MSDRVRMLSAEGSRVFREYLEVLREAPGAAVPWSLLTDPSMSEDAPFHALIEREPHGRPFADRHEFGVYLVGALANADRARISLEHRLWNWFALYFFDQLCPPDASGARAPLRDLSVYLLDEKYVWTRYYRHFVRAPWLAVSLHPETSRAILIQGSAQDAPLTGRGELFEQIAGRQSLFRSPTVMGAVYSLYFDPATGRPRAGTGGSRGGSPRRLGAVLNQLGLTYDLEWGESDIIIGLLPNEFARWTRHADQTASG